MYTQYEQAWLEDPSAIRIVLVEAQVYNVPTSTDNYLYLSTDNYITTDGSISFLPLIKNNITLNETLSADGSGAMTFGDIEIANHNGEYDVYFDQTKYIWSNLSIKIYYGDARWVCANIAEIRSKFLPIFNGIIDDADSRNRTSFNIKIRDKLERLNVPLTEDKLGPYGTWTGGQQNIDTIKPLVFGEVFNMTPLLMDPTKLKYMYNNGPVDALIEIRDNGAPLTASIVQGASLACTVTNGSITSVVNPGAIPVGSNYMVDDEVYIIDANSTPKAVFGATIIDNTMYVNSMVSGVISVGMKLTGTGITTGTVVSALGIGTGGLGTYILNLSATETNISVLGVNIPAIYKVTAVNGSGAITAGTITVAGTGYLNTGTKSAGLYGISTLRKVTAADNSVGIFCLAQQSIGTVTCSVRGINKSVDLSTGTVTNTYSNTIANIVALIATQYGRTTTKFTAADLDPTNLNSAESKLVGVLINDTTNVLNVCKQIVNSIGAQIFITRAGLLQIIRYDGTGFTNALNIDKITEEDILYNSLMISNRPGVVGAIKLGYAKNYTVQTGLITSLLPAHKDTLAKDWLSLTLLNQETIDNYTLAQDTTQIDTQLIDTTQAQAEAKRRLAFYSKQRIIYKFTGTSRLLGLKLGQQVTLIHSRFNLYNLDNNTPLGRIGQVVTLSPNWTTGQVDVEVLIK